MEKRIFRAQERGAADYGWLQARYSFSFANFFNPKLQNFGALRVLNDDIVSPGMGFGEHPHQNMEIISIPLGGALKHRDSMGQEWMPLKAGEVQVMSAGTGVRHSEMNLNRDQDLNLFQIWIIPDKMNVAPRYGQKEFQAEERKNQWQTLVTSIEKPVEGALEIHQDAKISRISLEAGKTTDYALSSPNHGLYAMLISGKLEAAEVALEAKDALGVWKTDKAEFRAEQDSDLLLIEVPMEF